MNRIVSLLTQRGKNVKYIDLLGSTLFADYSLQFALPPQWASEFPRRISFTFPSISQRHPVLYIQSFVHPTFTQKQGETSTMKLLEPLGEAFLSLIVEDWITHTFPSIRSDERVTLFQLLMSNMSLSNIARSHWKLSDLILAENSLALLSERMQYLKVLEQNNFESPLPDSYVSSCVKSFVGAIALNHEYSEARKFCCEKVLPFLG